MLDKSLSVLREIDDVLGENVDVRLDMIFNGSGDWFDVGHQTESLVMCPDIDVCGCIHTHHPPTDVRWDTDFFGNVCVIDISDTCICKRCDLYSLKGSDFTMSYISRAFSIPYELISLTPLSEPTQPPAVPSILIPESTLEIAYTDSHFLFRRQGDMPAAGDGSDIIWRAHVRSSNITDLIPAKKVTIKHDSITETFQGCSNWKFDFQENEWCFTFETSEVALHEDS